MLDENYDNLIEVQADAYKILKDIALSDNPKTIINRMVKQLDDEVKEWEREFTEQAIEKLINC